MEGAPLMASPARGSFRLTCSYSDVLPAAAAAAAAAPAPEGPAAAGEAALSTTTQQMPGDVCTPNQGSMCSPRQEAKPTQGLSRPGPAEVPLGPTSPPE